MLFQNHRLITGTGHVVCGELILIHMARESEPSSLEQYLVVSKYEFLLVVIGIAETLIFCVDVEQRTTDRIYNIGRHAIFLVIRGVSPSMRKFSVVRGNCLYHAFILPPSRRYEMREYSLRSRKHMFLHPFSDKPFAIGSRPFSLPQVLMPYCMFRNPVSPRYHRRKRQLCHM